jgi:hypothetical protein
MKKKLRLLMILWIAALSPMYAQERQVTGKVTNDAGEALVGVTISIKGTSRGTNSDVNGSFKINVGPTSSLIFTYVGYVNQEILVGNKSLINVQLVAANETLDEVVVTTFVPLKSHLLQVLLLKLEQRN